MNLICKMFGHKSLTTAGYAGGVGYSDVLGSAHDGLGRHHLYLEAKCPRCGETYHICNVHVPTELVQQAKREALLEAE